MTGQFLGWHSGCGDGPMFAIHKDNWIEVNMADFLRWLTETGKIDGFSVPEESNDWCEPVVYEFTSMADEGRAPASSMRGTKLAAWYNRDQAKNYQLVLDFAAATFSAKSPRAPVLRRRKYLRRLFAL